MWWEPFAELDRMRKRFEKFFEEIPPSTGLRQPLTDIKVEPESVKVFIELPGVDKKDVEINVTDNELEVKSESKAKKEVDKKGYYHYERSYSGFYRLIPLPIQVIPEKTSAEFKDGVLTVTLARAEAKKEKKPAKIIIK